MGGMYSDQTDRGKGCGLGCSTGTFHQPQIEKAHEGLQFLLVSKCVCLPAGIGMIVARKIDYNRFTVGK